ncbi:unnamed protein product [Orchesella dallaii]|uniref:Uncharacterized protein n=1 Tax=Orchesella dallaii TaxID=48710 RepID=A0ABP1PUA0_9HEXA
MGYIIKPVVGTHRVGRRRLACATKNKKSVYLFSSIFELLDLLGLSIIILITTTSSRVCGVSIAAITVTQTHPSDAILSGNYSAARPSQPNLVIINPSQNGRPPSVGGSLSVALGNLVLPNYSVEERNTVKKAELTRRSGSDTRISSNQDVTTLALAVDNSSSVAIANINSSWNNVVVSIANPNNHQENSYPYL